MSNKLRIRERKLNSALSRKKEQNTQSNISKNINNNDNSSGNNGKRLLNNKFERKSKLRKNALTNKRNIKYNRKEIIENGSTYKLDFDGRIIDNKQTRITNIHQRINNLSNWGDIFFHNNDNEMNNNNNIKNNDDRYNEMNNNNINNNINNNNDRYNEMKNNDNNNNNDIVQFYDSSYNNDKKDCINWNLQLYNDLFTYGINSAVNTLNDNGYLLGQYQSPGITLDDFTLFTPENTSSIFYMETNSSGEILSAFNLWRYNGVREDYQFGQLEFTSDSINLIILTTFIGEITFNDNSIISENNGNTMIGKFKLDGTPIWVRQITARSIDDVYFTLDSNDNIYICGTFTGSLQVSDPSSPMITSNLENNMFIGRIDTDGTTQWLKTALGTGYNTGEGIDYSPNDNTIVTCGNYTETFILDNFTLADTIALTNTWIAKLNLDGSIVNLISPHRRPTEDPILIDFFDGGQIVSSSNGDIYMAGDMLGYFVFTEDIQIIAERFSVFVAKLNSNLEFQWISILQVSIPVDNFYQPKLTVVEGQSTVVVTNFGFGEAIFYKPNTGTSTDNENDNGNNNENENNNILFKCNGSGTLDILISQLNISDGTWICSDKMCGFIENFSIDIVSISDDVYIAGSRIISNSRTDAMLINIAI